MKEQISKMLKENKVPTIEQINSAKFTTKERTSVLLQRVHLKNLIYKELNK